MSVTNKNALKKWQFFWLAWGGLIVVLSVAPSSSLLDVSISDKMLHAVFYVPMTLIPAVTFKRGKDGSVVKIGLAVFVIGVLLEAIQYHIPGRFFSIADMAANCVGLCAGTILGLAWNAVANTVNGHRSS